MIKVTRKKTVPPPVPPDSVVIELDIMTARELYELLQHTRVGADGRLSGPICHKVSEEELSKDTRFGGHTWMYKRVVDMLVGHLYPTLKE